MDKYLARVDDEKLGDLLAVIHRDGGHHRREHGTIYSVEIAKEKVLDYRRRLDDIFHIVASDNVTAEDILKIRQLVKTEETS
jgi:hypothetical protein